MTNEKLKINHNKLNISSISFFASINGRYSNYEKDCYFLCFLGCDKPDILISELQQVNTILNQRKQQTGAGYLQLSALNPSLTPEQVFYYQLAYVDASDPAAGLSTHFSFSDPVLASSLNNSYLEILRLYKENTANCSDSMLKNFGIKLLFWMDLYFPELFCSDTPLIRSPKCIYTGRLKIQEFLFLRFLSNCGCDVLILHTAGELSISSNLMTSCQCHFLGNTVGIELPNICVASFQPENTPVKTKNLSNTHKEAPKSSEQDDPSLTSESVHIKLPVRPSKASKSPEQDSSLTSGSAHIKLPKRPSRTPSQDLSTAETSAHATAPSNPIRNPVHSTRSAPESRHPLKYEQLAQFAGSVVMIEVYDPHGECFKTGSGVCIGKAGYILTNFHVACDGAYYEIRMENESRKFYTNELLKYNQLYDLALLRIERTCIPIPLLSPSETLVRGQQVIAIGSPLGLFNSVSDGIISGFRKVEQISMIQFTAPTSHGSSGGALLNLYGELIGIITAGFDDGQNLNLAVDYQIIYPFVRGFLN